jgi:hypothetical protein
MENHKAKRAVGASSGVLLGVIPRVPNGMEAAAHTVEAPGSSSPC